MMFSTLSDLPITLTLDNAEDTYNFGFSLGESLPPGTVLLLMGNLGTGKTTLIQGLGAGLGIQDTIESPTFTLINEYFNGRVPLYHLDLYRLSPPEIDSLNLEIYWEGEEVPLGIVAIEWAEKLTYYPPDYLQISLSYQGEIADVAATKRCVCLRRNENGG